MRFERDEPRPGIVGVGSAYPKRVVTNADVATAIGRGPEGVAKLADSIGVVERGWVELGGEIATSDLATEAVRSAIAHASIFPDELLTVSVGTSSPDHISSPDAAVVQHALGLRNDIRAYDTGNNACVAFVHALANSVIELTSRARKSGPHAVVGVEILTPILRTASPGIATMFGDGGGAVIVDNFTPPKSAPRELGGIGMAFGADGSHALDLYVPAGGSREFTTNETAATNKHTLVMDGKVVLENGIIRMAEMGLAALEDAGMKIRDVDWFIPHQANIKIINGVIDRLGLDRNKVLININRRGNMSAGSIPSALSDGVESGLVKPYQFVLAMAFGAGFNYGAIGMPYAGPQRKTT